MQWLTRLSAIPITGWASGTATRHRLVKRSPMESRAASSPQSPVTDGIRKINKATQEFEDLKDKHNAQPKAQ
jgi:hypothetical protein